MLGELWWRTADAAPRRRAGGERGRRALRETNTRSPPRKSTRKSGRQVRFETLSVASQCILLSMQFAICTYTSQSLFSCSDLPPSMYLPNWVLAGAVVKTGSRGQVGPMSQNWACNAHSCSTEDECVWQDWSDWSTCPITSPQGGGQRTVCPARGNSRFEHVHFYQLFQYFVDVANHSVLFAPRFNF